MLLSVEEDHSFGETPEIGLIYSCTVSKLDCKMNFFRAHQTALIRGFEDISKWQDVERDWCIYLATRSV